MLVTGWDRAQLGRQPSEVVQRLCWRLFAAREWRGELVEFARGPAPAITDTDARDRKAAAMTAVEELERILFPEDEQDG